MISPEASADALLEPILDAPQAGRRKLVALIGAPASGKSTLATILADRMTQSGCTTRVIPMDGFHLDNGVLSELGLLDRKGAPETFDAPGLLRLVSDLAEAEQLFYPLFDRAEDLSRAGAGMIAAPCDCVIVEGNYLLLDAPVWRELAAHWDISIRLDVPQDILQQRLVQRWLDFGLPHEQATQRAMSNDMANAALIAERSLSSTLTL